MKNTRTYIIAEAGVNHNGDPEKAFKLIDIASNAGADAVKFQIFKPENLATKDTAKADYQMRLTNKRESHLEMLKNLSLPNSVFKDLSIYAAEKNIEFLSTAFDSESLEFLINSIGVQRLKIPSGEITNGPFLLDHAATKKQIIISTGMANIEEIKEALGVIAYGYISNDNTIPNSMDYNQTLESDIAKEILKEKVILLHCTSDYPASHKDINLNAIKTMANTFNLGIGYSDHSLGVNVSLAAVAMGASVIEKHFTLDKELPGPDHRASLDSDELSEMVSSIRELEIILGNGDKKPTNSEEKNKAIARKSLVASKPIKKGEKFSDKNLTFKRPGSGISPMRYWNIIGQKSKNNYNPDELINE